MSLLTISIWQQEEINRRAVAATVVMFIMGLVVLMTSHQRASLGVGGSLGESMLVDLRDRLLTQARSPTCRATGSVQSALYSAGGTPFAGDFVVATRPLSSTRLEVTVVDVSGKGEDAGTRALHALRCVRRAARGDASRRVPARRQRLPASCRTGRRGSRPRYTSRWTSSPVPSRSAPPVTRPPCTVRPAPDAGRCSAPRDPILGLIKDAEFTCMSGRLAPGDAVLLYTDGMVEEPRLDIDLGIDRMLGETESLLRGTWDDAANRLAASLGSRDDDRAIVLVHRRW